MKRFKDLSINVKMPLLVGITGFVVMAVVCTILIISQRREAFDNTTKTIKSASAIAAVNLADYINSAAVIPRAFTHMAASVIQSDDIPQKEKRQRLLEELMLFSAAEKQMDNFWAIFENNAVDGLDEMFVDSVGSNSDGAFMPCILKGEMRVMSDNRTDKLFELTRTAGQEIFSEPYLYNLYGTEEHVLSYCFPVMVDGRIVGVVGRDFSIAQLNKIAISYDITGRGRLVSSDGIIIVHANPERIGGIIGDGHQATLEGLAKGKDFELMVNFRGNDEYQAFFCIQFGECDKNWFYGVSIPASDVYAALRKSTIYLIFLTFIGALVIAGFGSMLIRWMLKDVGVLNSTIDKLSLGHINQQIEDSKSGDEMGVMKNKLYQFVGSLKRTALFASDIGHGKLDAEYELLSDGDVLGKSLLDMRKSLQKAENEQTIRAKEEEQRNWGTQGLAKFAEILRRDNNNLETLSYNVISNLVKYLGANQGGIFVLNDAESGKEKVLEMKACYAFDRKKFVEKQIRPGEGLVGTCYLEGEPIYMTELPDHYISITSGLGEASPNAVLICPLKVNDIIYGVIELASFRAFEPYQLDFVQKVSESIASTIGSVKVSIRTNNLLAQSKLQAEEMANQEEELRQNMEEMQATQEEMYRREADLQKTLEGLSKSQLSAKVFAEKMHFYESTLDSPPDTMIYVADLDQKIVYMNKACLTMLGKSKEQIIGKYCYDVWNVEICKTDRCAIECLKRSGKSSRVEFNLGDRRLTTHASSVKDLYGNDIGYAEVIEDITEVLSKSQ